ncbi:MAG: DHH family phosphoesterase [Chloroflexota bacterium]|nr:MAG: DHH family phosphoesterase [Chloroflexota bacterium]
MLPAAAIESIRLALEKAETVLVICHVSPDGDAISSLTATGLALEQLGKTFTLVCDDGLPERFLYLPLSHKVSARPAPDVKYDLIIALDAGDARRLGKAYADLAQPRPLLINIDHHITNTRYGQINLVTPESSATSEILLHLFSFLGVELTEELAVCLLTGLVTDTLNFRTAGVNAETLRAAATLVEAGAVLFDVTSKALALKPVSTLFVWQVGLNNMHIEDGLLWTSISNSEREEVGHRGGSSFGLGNMMADVYQAKLSAVMLEMADGRVSVGFRCRPPYSVSELAISLGGGGHHLAAGCTIDGPLAEAVSLVVSKSKESIRQQRLALSQQRTSDVRRH